MPGDEAIYGAVGDQPHHAWDTALEEVDYYASDSLNSEDMIIGSRHFEFDKVLDLTNPATLEHLGLTEKMITKSKGISQYPLTHQLGNIVKNQGFSAIIAPAARSNGTNIIIFKGN